MNNAELKARILEAMGWCPDVLTSREEASARDFFETLDKATGADMADSYHAPNTRPEDPIVRDM